MLKGVLQAERQIIPDGSSKMQEKKKNRDDNMWVNINEYLLYKQEEYYFGGY